MLHFLKDVVVGPPVRLAFWAKVLLWSFCGIFQWISHVDLRRRRLRGVQRVLPRTPDHRTPSLGLRVATTCCCSGPSPLQRGSRPRTTVSNVASVLPNGTQPHQDWYERKSTLLFISFQFFFMSVVTHLDLATNALFLAKVLATNNCQVRRDSGCQNTLQDIEHFWHHVWETSFCRPAEVFPLRPLRLGLVVRASVLQHGVFCARVD